MSAALNKPVASTPAAGAPRGCAPAAPPAAAHRRGRGGLRKHVRERAVAIALSLVDQTKLVTAASELARNTIKYGGGGEVHLDAMDDGMRRASA
jgi:hypothetical protein